MNNNKALGILYIVMAGFFFSLMTFFVRISGDLPTMQKAFFRNAVAALVSILMLARSPEGFHIKKASWPWLFVRAACGTLGLICNFYAVDHIHLADANILNKLSPFFAIMASYFVLKEKANKVEWITVFVAFTGALFVIKPSFQMEALYGFIGVMGGLGAGLAYTFVRKLDNMGERGPVIVMFFSLFSTLVTAPFLIFDFHPMTGKQLLFLLLAGISATGGQLSITAAYTKAPAKEISIFDYSQIIFAALLGFYFLGQVPDVYSIIGYVIILSVSVYRWRYNK
ncbi:MAG: DMT family transporter [Eubacterium sp.]|nr:DMT family transporter [Eubacterium sp.]